MPSKEDAMKRQKNNSVVCLKINTQSFGENREKLSIDLLIEILSRLPSKSIAICCCVSKQWSSLLRSQYFTELFLTRSHPRLLFTFRFDGKLHLYSSLQPQNFGDNLSVVATGYHMGYSGHRYCQSVHGFIYLNSYGILKGKIDMVPEICNPSTGQRITLPNVAVENIWVRSFFGYDPIRRQFKVLCLTMFNRQQTTSNKYKVLTIGTGELLWRELECPFIHYPHERKGGICINGVLYYIDWIKNDYTTIVCFDVRYEKFSFIEIEKGHIVTLINYKGKLGVAVYFDDGSLTEIWVLYDIKKVIWSKHIFFLPNSGFLAVESMWATDTGEIAWSSSSYRLTNPLYVFYYNLERQSVKRVEIKGMEDKEPMGGNLYKPSFFTFTNYVENLMFL